MELCKKGLDKVWYSGSRMSTRVRTWEILDYGKVPRDAATVPYEMECGHEAELPVLGRVIAMTCEGGVIFDPGEYALPTTIRCRRCGRVYTTAKQEELSVR